MVTGSSTLFRVLAALLLIGVLAGGAYMAFQAGQAQGYALGLSADTGITGEGDLEGLRGMPPYRPFNSPLSLLIGLVIAIILISFVFKLIGFVVFGAPFHYHRHWKYGTYPYHPWHCGYPYEAPPVNEPGMGKAPESPAVDK